VKLLCLLAYWFLSICPVSSGKIGQSLNGLRAVVLRPIFKRMGKGVKIGRFCSFHNPKEIEFDDASGVGNFSSLFGPTKIGKNTMIAFEFLGITGGHNFDDLRIPIGHQGNKQNKPILIEDNCWIGARVTILPGVKVAKGTVVGAGSVLRSSTTKDSVVFGNPAQEVRKRGKRTS
jgi:maltose O-acetyltransferase